MSERLFQHASEIIALARDAEMYRALRPTCVESMARDLTACRSELASIAILMQERGRLPDLGGDNYALVAGAVTEYVLAMELAVIALNGDRNDLLIQIGNLNNLLACDDDCYHAPMCVRWEHGDEEVVERERRYYDCAACGRHVDVDEAFYAATLCASCSSEAGSACLPRCAGCAVCATDDPNDPSIT